MTVRARQTRAYNATVEAIAAFQAGVQSMDQMVAALQTDQPYTAGATTYGNSMPAAARRIHPR